MAYPCPRSYAIGETSDGFPTRSGGSGTIIRKKPVFLALSQNHSWQRKQSGRWKASALHSLVRPGSRCLGALGSSHLCPQCPNAAHLGPDHQRTSSGVLMEDLIHDFPRPVDFEKREHIGVAMTIPVREFEPDRGNGVDDVDTRLSLSRFAVGTHVGAAHGEPGAPPASAANRPCP